METPESRSLMEVKKEYASLRNNSSSITNPNIRLKYMTHGDPTVLQMAVYLGHQEFVCKLLSMKANVNTVTFHWGTALHVAVAQKRKSIIKKLIKAGANVNKIGSKNNCTPIYNALTATTFDHSIVQTLLHNGVDLNDMCVKTFTDAADLTPLEVAIYNKNPTIVEALLNYNANVNRININKQTPLDFAAGSPSIENIIKRHIVKMKAAGFEIIESNLKAVESEELDYFYKECLHEVEWMKTTYVKNANFPFYDVITKSGRELAVDMENNARTYIDVSKSDLDKMFKNYSDFLMWRLKRVIFIGNHQL